MKLIATKSMRYGGKDLQAGDDFEASDRDGNLLKAIRKAQEATEAALPATAPETPKKIASRKLKKSATYQTRRLMAKD